MGSQSNQHVPQSNQSGPNGVPKGTNIDPQCHQHKLKDLQKHTMRIEIEKSDGEGGTADGVSIIFVFPKAV